MIAISFLVSSARGPFREFQILKELRESGLPVPVPLAAACERHWLSYRGVLLMEQIPDVTPLQELLTEINPLTPVWEKVGACIREFHRVGLHHADLNVGNILVDQITSRVYLVDFDRCTLNPGLPVNGKANLSRFKEINGQEMASQSNCHAAKMLAGVAGWLSWLSYIQVNCDT